jgi:hypothetical protein
VATLGDILQERRAGAPDYRTNPGTVITAYRGGDPLQVIADMRSGTVETLCLQLTEVIRDEDELARMRSTRSRTAATMELLDKEQHLIWRLVESGFSVVEIPKVLGALATGTEVDSAILTELLQSLGPVDPGLCLDMPAPETPRVSDSLSVLYVIGKHYRIEPDYQLALGQIPLDELAELRQLSRANCPPRRLAEVLAVAETTKLAIRARAVTSLSVAEYAITAKAIARRFNGYIIDESATWPVPSPDLIRRLGGGFWDQALRTVALKRVRAADRFQEEDFPRALEDFGKEVTRDGLSPSPENYDRWLIAEIALRRDRPSVLELLKRYGRWDAALSEVLGVPSDNRLGAYAKANVDDVELLFELPDSSHEAAWVRAGEYLCELLARLPRRRSLVIEYAEAGTATFRPYARAGRTVEGIWCEISPEQTHANGADLVGTDHLHYEEWAEPDVNSPHWRTQEMPFHDSGHQILDALRHGWQCLDPWQLRWSTRQPVSGPGRNNGVTIEDALAGDVQSLRNAG